MSRKIIVSVLLLLSAGMLGLTILFYSRSDRIAPQIQFNSEEISYSPGDDESKLLEGVTAIDNKDGDLSDKVFIEKIVPAIDGTTATVTYVVVDSSNNVAKVARIINYSSNDSKENNEDGAVTVSGGAAAGQTDNPGQGEEKTTENDDSNKPGDETETNNSEEESEDKSESEDESESEDRTPREDGRPAIFLNTKKATVEYGTEIDYMSYIDDIVDDKDGLEIWRSISIDGREDAAERGTHTLSYYVTDSDGNMSDIVKLELTVK